MPTTPTITTQDLARMYESGLSTTEISKRTGIDATNLYRRLKRAGVDFRKQTGKFADDNRAAMLASGMSVAAVARQLGISEGGLRHWIKRRAEREARNAPHT